MVARHGLLSSLWTELLWLILVTMATSPISSELQLQQIVNCNFPKSGTRGHSLPTQGQSRCSRSPSHFFEIYKRKMNKDLELARLKKLAKEKQLNQETNVKLESAEEILA
ncbi:hypothetical protein Adt_49374 [Abeliophyllum distichum]|uniref:Uncharacterized protein n=1 Tax=Abeliophyllum distichum TaxID=126358 RepID=A0ABD1NNE4_9LAMI